MAMEISISPEGWEDIRDTLEVAWSKEQLVEAVTEAMLLEADDELEEGMSPQEMDAFSEKTKQDISNWSHDMLVEEAYSFVEKNMTASNDMSEYYIDKNGGFTVNPSELDKANKKELAESIEDTLKLIDIEATGNMPSEVTSHYREMGNKDLSPSGLFKEGIELSDGSKISLGKGMSIKSIEAKDPLREQQIREAYESQSAALFEKVDDLYEMERERPSPSSEYGLG